MGKGDKKTKRGKIVIGSSGVRRARKKTRSTVAVVTKVVPQQVSEADELELAAKVAAKKSAKKPEASEGSDEKSKASKARKKTAADELPLDEPKQD
jgi:ribosomal small subunit protein bTHX